MMRLRSRARPSYLLTSWPNLTWYSFLSSTIVCTVARSCSIILRPFAPPADTDTGNGAGAAGTASGVAGARVVPPDFSSTASYRSIRSCRVCFSSTNRRLSYSASAVARLNSAVRSSRRSVRRPSVILRSAFSASTTASCSRRDSISSCISLLPRLDSSRCLCHSFFSCVRVCRWASCSCATLDSRMVRDSSRTFCISAFTATSVMISSTLMAHLNDDFGPEAARWDWDETLCADDPMPLTPQDMGVRPLRSFT
mmetsp:Transcript_22955/g.65037  ORF Transcript_22955/g.65037 Transcript_22955/m.65037 type:complete len:254 (-) Transcript_22955:521-1282(-)